MHALSEVALKLDCFTHEAQCRCLWGECVAIFDDLPIQETSVHTANRARSLHYHGVYLHRHKQYEQACTMKAGAVDFRRRLHAFDPVTYSSPLIFSLRSYAMSLRCAGQLAAARHAEQESMLVRGQRDELMPRDSSMTPFLADQDERWVGHPKVVLSIDVGTSQSAVLVAYYPSGKCPFLVPSTAHIY